MRTGVAILVVAAGMASQAAGQLRGLPVADTAAPETGGPYRITVSGTFVDEGYAVGARWGLGLTENTHAFLGAGAVRPEDADDTLGLQAGVLFGLPPRASVDLAIRATLYYLDRYRTVAADDVDTWGVNVMALSSGRIRGLNPDLQGYVGLGVNREERELESRLPGRRDRSADETDIVVVGGLVYRLNMATSLFAELGFQDKLSAGLGLRFEY